ncbi:MAG: orotidine-5'-phosphate decarboxylase [Pirellulales bacterium]
MEMSFAKRLEEALLRTRSPLCVGLDPRLQSLPKSLQPAQPTDLTAVAKAYGQFSRDVIDVVRPLCGVVKPQAAFYEQLGPAGFQALAETVHYARQQGLIVVLDAKRGDIGTTAEAYADAFLAGPQAPIPADALTVNPYLGADSLEPFVDRASRCQTGIFVLVKTSNPGGGMFQDLVANGQTLYRHVAQHVEQLAASSATSSGQRFGAVGAVVGATYTEQLAELRAVMPHAWLLIPGFGAQGGTADEVRPGFHADGLGAIVNSSRGIIFAHQRREFAHLADWQQAVEQATREATLQLRAAAGWS